MQHKKIYLAGHSGMVGSAIHRTLMHHGFEHIVTRDYPGLDLTRQEQVEALFSRENPEIVIIAAARVGGIMANNAFRAQFIYENLMIEANIIHAAFLNKVEKLVFLGSSCIYPKLAPQPLKEEYLLTDTLEYTNEPYAVAKIAGIKMCESYYRQYGCNFFSLMPTNLYGLNDNFDPTTSHVLPALVRKFYEAKINNQNKVTVWGTGMPRREFLYVDDLAQAVLFFLQEVNAADLYEQGISCVNIGTGQDLTIKELAEIIAKIIGFDGTIEFDSSKPDGTPQKLLDVTRVHQLGWKHRTELEEGIKKTVNGYKEKVKS